MTLDRCDTAGDAAVAAADLIAARARAAVAARGQFVWAVSGGRTPALMLRALARADVPWHSVHVVQVDERIAPAGHVDRNLTGLRENLIELVGLTADRVHAMPVESADLDSAATSYAQALSAIAGVPPVLDLVHLGIGPDGHTASLFPGDAVLDVADVDVAVTGVCLGRRRMTLTLPMVNRSREILWVVTGADKAPMLARLLAGDQSIPAGRVDQVNARVIADRASLRPH